MRTVSATPPPSLVQVREIPATTEMTVPPEFLDENQHMNIQHHMVLGARALGRRLEHLGIDLDYIDNRRLTTFTAEQHLRYYAELRLGQELSVHVQLLDRSAGALHAMSYVLNCSTDKLACTLESSLVHVSMDTRRPTPFPAEIADRLDLALKEQADIGWPAPVCGAMGIRRA